MIKPKIDLLSVASFAHGQPHDQFRWLRANDPVYRHEEPDGPGFWAVTRYEDVCTISRDPKTYSSYAGGIAIQDMNEEGLAGSRNMMLFMDPPQHTRYRALVSQQFIPRSARAMQSRIEELARQIIDRVIDRGECDLVSQIAGELPSYVIAHLMGIPLEDGRRLYEWTEKMHSSSEAVPEIEKRAASLEMLNYALGVAEEKRKRPGDDLATRLLNSEIDGDRLTPTEYTLFFLLLINAGGDTTRNLLAGGMLALFKNPDQRRRLQANLDGLLPLAVEEMLRYVSPVIYMRRTATCDTKLRGKKIRAGDKVVMYYGSANRDEELFADPDKFDVGRTPNDHIAFGGGGTHYCLGAHIARIEIQVMLREILTDYRISRLRDRRNGCHPISSPGRADCRCASPPEPRRMPETPEVVIVGGGIGGSALATALARAGISTLILEKSTVHLDHVRGEWVAPWGVAETQRLGLYDTLIEAGGHHLGEHITFGDDVDEATARALAINFAAFEGAGFKPPLCMRHPDMCNLLNSTAVKSGAALLRNVSDVLVTPGHPPEVNFRHEGRAFQFKPRLVIGADGRNSIVRGQVGIVQHRDPTHHLMTGMLVDDIEGWPPSLQTIGTENDINFLVFPQSATRARLYICYGLDEKRRFAGADSQARFLDAFRLRTLPGSEILANGTPAGPCPSYGNEDTWTDTPFVPGVVLIGDAAGHNDPIIGQGLSITYRDVRIVRDLMLENREWTPATFQPYAEERRERMRRLRFTATVVSILTAEFGERARQRRIRMRQELDRGTFINVLPAAFLGPETIPAEAFDTQSLDRLRSL